MRRFELTQETLRETLSCWEEFLKKAGDAIDEIRRKTEKDLRDEGNSDIRSGKYTQSSVQKWYDNEMSKLNATIEKWISRYQEFNEKAMALIGAMKDDYFTSADSGYRIIYNFNDFSRKREKKTDGSTSTGVTIRARDYWYEYNGYRVSFKMPCPSVHFTAWHD